MGKHPVQPRNADIVKPHDLIAECLRGEGSLLRSGQVTRPAGGNDDFALTDRLRHLTDQTDLPVRVILQWECFTDCLRLVGRQTGDEDVVAAFLHRIGNGNDLRGGLAGAKDHLRHALPQPAVMVKLCNAQILEGGFFDLQRRLFRGNSTIRDLPEKRIQITSHGAFAGGM